MFTLLRWCEDCVEGWRRMCKFFPYFFAFCPKKTLKNSLRRSLFSSCSVIWLSLSWKLTFSSFARQRQKGKRRMLESFVSGKFQLNKSQHIFFHKLSLSCYSLLLLYLMLAPFFLSLHSTVLLTDLTMYECRCRTSWVCKELTTACSPAQTARAR